MKFFILSMLLSALAVSFAGCDPYNGPNIDPTGSQCAGGVAQIGVGDGFLEYLCGCTGSPASGTVVGSPANLTCHIPSGTIVIFEYIAIQDQHQIVNTSGLAFPAGTIITPGSGVTTSTTGVLTQVGTYGFQDDFNTALQGSIIVP
jgi:hypothetical protein